MLLLSLWDIPRWSTRFSASRPGLSRSAREWMSLEPHSRLSALHLLPGTILFRDPVPLSPCFSINTLNSICSSQGPYSAHHLCNDVRLHLLGCSLEVKSWLPFRHVFFGPHSGVVWCVVCACVCVCVCPCTLNVKALIRSHTLRSHPPSLACSRLFPCLCYKPAFHSARTEHHSYAPENHSSTNQTSKLFRFCLRKQR